MATTVVRTNNMENGFTIVTHVIPMQSTPTGAGQNESETSAGFFSRLPARNTEHDHSTPGSGRTASMLGILGTMQLMTGVVSFMLAIVLSQPTDPRLFTSSLHGYWGSVIYISAGSFSVAAKNKTHRCLVSDHYSYCLLIFISYLLWRGLRRYRSMASAETCPDVVLHCAYFHSVTWC
ncbi:hypothetical protein NFI96_023792 [Prochilodus magdalenae]|nr:hypothetical protein NFI96_023792 [Prochilodus magdalenae]